MVNRIGLTAILLGLSSITWGQTALQDARTAAGNPGVFDGGCTAGSCGAQIGNIDNAAAGAMKKGGLTVAPDQTPREPIVAEVPAPALNPDKEGAKNKPGFFSKLVSGKGLLYGIGGALVGAGAGIGIGWLIGGPIGGLIGGIIGGILGAIGGYFMSKLLAK